VINDKHKELIDFYKCIKDGHADDIHSFMENQVNETINYKRIRDEMIIDTPLDNGKRFYFLRKTCFRGLLTYNKNKKFSVSHDHTERNKKLNYSVLKDERYMSLLQNTVVLNTDFEYLFENYNNQQNFMFLDPPYDCGGLSNYGYCDFGKENHEKLAECFKNTDIRCLMVIGKTDFIENLYDGYIVDQYMKGYDINNMGKGVTHLIIKNY
jgi:DNA adenine methylase